MCSCASGRQHAQQSHRRRRRRFVCARGAGMNREPPYLDMLLEQLLRETLGGDRSRDITERVMAQARAYDRVRRHWWVAAGSAIAALVAISISIWMFWPQSYPAPAVVD